MENFKDKLTSLLTCCDRTHTTYAEDACHITEELNKAGYFIGKNSPAVKDILEVLSECIVETVNRPEQTREGDAKFILRELNNEGYRIVGNKDELLEWKDATNITLKNKWAIVVYKWYDVSDDKFIYHPKVIRNYTPEEDLVKGNQRAYKLCEINLPE